MRHGPADAADGGLSRTAPSLASHRLLLALLVFLALQVSAAPREFPEQAWLDNADALVRAAASTQTLAVLFQQQVDASREALRQMVKEATPAAEPARNDLHMTMVLVSALLQSAATCQRGGNIVCPAYLLIELRKATTVARDKLAAIEAHEMTPAVDN